MHRQIPDGVRLWCLRVTGRDEGFQLALCFSFGFLDPCRGIVSLQPGREHDERRNGDLPRLQRGECHWEGTDETSGPDAAISLMLVEA